MCLHVHLRWVSVYGIHFLSFASWWAIFDVISNQTVNSQYSRAQVSWAARFDSWNVLHLKKNTSKLWRDMILYFGTWKKSPEWAACITRLFRQLSIWDWSKSHHKCLLMDSLQGFFFTLVRLTECYLLGFENFLDRSAIHKLAVLQGIRVLRFGGSVIHAI